MFEPVVLIVLDSFFTVRFSSPSPFEVLEADEGFFPSLGRTLVFSDLFLLVSLVSGLVIYFVKSIVFIFRLFSPSVIFTRLLLIISTTS